MNKPIEPIGLADVRALLVGGDGYCDTHGVGLAMALDAMTSASRDLMVAYDALYTDEVAVEDIQSMVFRVGIQLKNTAEICWRVASAENITTDAPGTPEDEAAE